MLDGSIDQLDVFNVLEAAMIRGVLRGRESQGQRKESAGVMP
jgi:hypothetical protein